MAVAQAAYTCSFMQVCPKARFWVHYNYADDMQASSRSREFQLFIVITSSNDYNYVDLQNDITNVEHPCTNFTFFIMQPQYGIILLATRN